MFQVGFEAKRTPALQRVRQLAPADVLRLCEALGAIAWRLEREA